MINESGLSFKDISSETYREYVFANGAQVRINRPLWFHKSETGGHRILDSDNISHYIPPTWIHLHWGVWDGKPNFSF